MKKKFNDFLEKKGISAEQYKALKADETADLYNEFNEEQRKEIDGLIADKATKEDIATAVDGLRESQLEQMKTLNAAMSEMGLSIKEFTEPKAVVKANKGLKEYLEENSKTLKAIKENGKQGKSHEGFSFSVNKATEVATDIGGRDYLGTIEPGIGKQPVRRTSITDLFRRKGVSTEYLHYWEQDVVTRDAKFVIACATSTHNTKMTWAKRTVELAKIRDIIDICIDMLDDYSFVESELKMLVDESIVLKADFELLLGASLASTDMLSIDFISSEFNAANPLASYALAFQVPTLGDLTSAMKGQIYTFGQENAWDANTVIMNYNDKIKYLHAKDLNGNYLFPNFVFGATDVVNGMRIVTSPIVSPNTLYVLDSTKGSILDRQNLTVTAAFENKDNIEHELVTMVGVERLQFHVRLIDRDAFMKCSDIAAAILAITKP